MAPDTTAAIPGRVAVLGLGLMGGSLARALGAVDDAPEVVGWTPSGPEGDAALAAGALDRLAGSPRDAVAGAELVILATPLQPACDLIPTLLPVLDPAATLTDLASLKAPVAEAAHAAGAAERWVGSHPMCGGEQSGFGAARSELYRDAWIWLVDEGAHATHRARVEALWRLVGAHVHPIGAVEHDRLMARVSHLPQLTANALAVLLEDAGLGPADLGPGGRDMTRLAGSSPTVWADLLAHAPRELPEALRDLAERLGSLADLVEARDLEAVGAWMTATRAWKEGA